MPIVLRQNNILQMDTKVIEGVLHVFNVVLYHKPESDFRHVYNMSSINHKKKSWELLLASANNAVSYKENDTLDASISVNLWMI